MVIVFSVFLIYSNGFHDLTLNWIRIALAANLGTKKTLAIQAKTVIFES